MDVVLKTLELKEDARHAKQPLSENQLDISKCATDCPLALRLSSPNHDPIKLVLQKQPFQGEDIISATARKRVKNYLLHITVPCVGCIP